MKFNRVNNVVGWIVGLIACTVYVLTMEPSGSFWDCGEFVSCCFKLQIPHPPGAPLFTLLGRFFIILFGDNPLNAGRAVNFMSAMASGMTILFLFWTITHFARKLVLASGKELTSTNIFNIMAAGVVGALAYTFTDSFWYSAVEGEVYAMSSLCTALVFWAILKWEHEVDQESNTDGHKFSRADRWIVFIFFAIGLSIGIHLLNLLTIPAIIMVYYFKRYKVTKWGTFWAFLVGCIITGVVQVVIVQWSIKGAGSFDIFFVNDLELPFFSGFAIYFILLALLLVAGLGFTETSISKYKLFPVWLSLLILLFCFPFLKSGGTFALFLVGLGVILYLCYSYRTRIFAFLRIALWCIIFMIVGYSTYFTTLERSSANPSVDMFNVDNPVSLVGYLSREQYGDWPILYGPDFTYRPPYKVKGDLYIQGDDKYEVVGKVKGQDFSAKPDDQDIQSLVQQNPEWDASKIGPHFFPRMWDNGNERNQAFVYREFGGLSQGQQPTMANNIKFFFNYQFRWMYWRYFMWNFTGRQNDLQGFGNIRDGNWNSGISFVDRMFHSTTDQLPDTAGRNNKANNSLFFLPLALGIIGLIYQYNRHRRDFLVTLVLFFFTGLAIVIYLNQSGYQPRERDYAYVGSFYVFAIWIGLGVMMVKDWITKAMKGNEKTAGYAAFAICLLAVPVIMGSQEWDDHDRSQKTLAPDLGKDYLESCSKDALLITFGDNDTYPLWFDQEVKGIRTDIRAMNYSLLGTDWYINQLRYKVNNSRPFDVIFSPEQIRGSNRDLVFTANYLQRVGYTQPIQGYDQNKYYDLYDLLKNVTGSDAPQHTIHFNANDDSDVGNILPVNKVSIPVDVEAVKKSMQFNPGDSIVSELKLDINKAYLQKNDLAVLAIIAANKWERPIYFTSTAELQDLGLGKYVRLEGLSYRLVPVANEEERGEDVQDDLAYKNIMNNFAYGSADKNGVYYDEENRRHINNIRQTHALVAQALIEEGRKDSARNILERYDQGVQQSNVPYGMTANRGNMHNRITIIFLRSAYLSGDSALAQKVSISLKKDLEQQLAYYASLGDGSMSQEQMAMEAYGLIQGRGGANLSSDQAVFANDILTSFQMLSQVNDWEKQYGGAKGSSTEVDTTEMVTPGGTPPPTDTSKP